MMKKYIPILTILLLGYCAVLWSQGRFIISFGDATFPQNALNDFYRMIYAWDSLSLGSSTFMRLGLALPYGTYLLITHILNISLIHVQIFWNYLLFTSLGLSMYFLVIQVIQDRLRYAAGLLAALLFMFNPWGVINLTMFIPFITFIPLVLGLYIRGLNGDRKLKYIIAISVLWCLISSFSLFNVRGFMFQWIILIFYLLFFCLANRRRAGNAIVFTIILFIFYILLNFYWLLPFIVNIAQSISGSAEIYKIINFTRLDSFELNSSTIYNTLRMLDDWSLIANFKGSFYFPWLTFYQRPFLIFLGFLPFIATLSSLFYIVKNRLLRYVHFMFFFAVLLFGFFISTGKYNPATMWFAGSLPLLTTLFSSPSYFGGIFVTIAYSVFIGYGFILLCKCTKNGRLHAIIFFSFICLIMIYGYPVWTGQFIPSGNKILGAGRYQLPYYVPVLMRKTSQDKRNYRIFPLPYSKLGYYAYNWAPSGFNGPDPLTTALNKPQVAGIGIGMQIANTTQQYVEAKSFFRLNSLLNVGYIMNKRDANLLHIKNNSWYVVPDQTFLNSLYENSKSIQSYGQIDLIRIPDSLFLPKLYTPLDIVLSDNSDSLLSIVSQKDYSTRTAIYFKNQNKKDSIQFLKNKSVVEMEKTILEYRMINATKYRVEVHGAKGILPLIMSESFHDGWGLYLTKPNNQKTRISNSTLTQGTIQNDNLPTGTIFETWFKKQINTNTNHLMVNGYANSWIIDTDGLCSTNKAVCTKNVDGSFDFELVIEFWQQRLYYLGLTISITTLIGCVYYFFIQRTTKKNES